MFSIHGICKNELYIVWFIFFPIPKCFHVWLNKTQMHVKSHFIFYFSFICKMGLYLSISLSNLKCFKIDNLVQNPDGHKCFINLEIGFMFFF